jgi:hypothetical protein
MSKRPDDEKPYVEYVPIPLDQPTIAWLAWMERTTGEPAAKLAGRYLKDLREHFGKTPPLGSRPH